MKTCALSIKGLITDLPRYLSLIHIFNDPTDNAGQTKVEVIVNGGPVSYTHLDVYKRQVLDEPTTGLDPQTRKSIWNVIFELRKNENLTVFLTTQYLPQRSYRRL